MCLHQKANPLEFPPKDIQRGGQTGWGRRETGTSKTKGLFGESLCGSTKDTDFWAVLEKGFLFVGGRCVEGCYLLLVTVWVLDGLCFLFWVLRRQPFFGFGPCLNFDNRFLFSAGVLYPWGAGRSHSDLSCDK